MQQQAVRSRNIKKYTRMPIYHSFIQCSRGVFVYIRTIPQRVSLAKIAMWELKHHWKCKQRKRKSKCRKFNTNQIRWKWSGARTHNVWDARGTIEYLIGKNTMNNPMRFDCRLLAWILNIALNEIDSVWADAN